MTHESAKNDCGTYNSLPTPAVVVELSIAEKNVEAMVAGLARYGIAHRPHIKAHRSTELAKLQLSLGATGITCAKLGEAEVMAQSGIEDILIAFPMIGEDKLTRYGALAQKCTLRSIVNSVAGAQGLSALARRLGKELEVLIELDGGVRRGGIAPLQDALDFAKSVAPLPGMRIVGLMYYPGLIYNEVTDAGLDRVAKLERDHLTQTAKILESQGFEMKILSGGNTPSAKRPHCLEGITEARPGNYLFNDCAQLYFGRVEPEDCALRVVSTVVCRPDGYSAIIDAGSKALSSDSFPTFPGFGHILGHKNLVVQKLNEEHGFLKSEEPMGLDIGERVAIVPNHACVVTNLADEVYGMRDGRFDHRIRIDARGKSA